MTKKYYTDYPFVELGDVGGQEAPVREIEILKWDMNKYVQIKVEGVISEIKSGYIYAEQGRYGEVPRLQFPRKHIGLF